jgi:hypothetical protein
MEAKAAQSVRPTEEQADTATPQRRNRPGGVKSVQTTAGASLESCHPLISFHSIHPHQRPNQRSQMTRWPMMMTRCERASKQAKNDTQSIAPQRPTQHASIQLLSLTHSLTHSLTNQQPCPTLPYPTLPYRLNTVSRPPSHVRGPNTNTNTSSSYLPTKPKTQPNTTRYNQ